MIVDMRGYIEEICNIYFKNLQYLEALSNMENLQQIIQKIFHSYIIIC